MAESGSAPIKLGEAVVELLTDERGLLAGFARAESEATGFVSRIGGVMSSFLSIAIPAGIAATLTAMVKHAAESAAELHELSQQTGVSVENLSRLQFAGARVNVSLNDMTVALKFLSRQMVAGENDVGKPSKALADLGIKAHDASGQIRSTISVMLDVADKFAHMEDGAKKTALAVELFGRSGIRMIPLLNEGRQGLEEMARASDRLGVTITAESAASAHDFEASMKVIKLWIKGVSNDLLETFIPSLATTARFFTGDFATSVDTGTESLDAFGKKAGEVEGETHGVRDFLKYVSTGIIVLDTAVHQVAAGLMFIVKAIDDVTFNLHHAGGGDVAKDLEKDWEALSKKIDQAGDEGAAALDALAKGGEHARDGISSIGDGADVAKQRIIDLNATIQQSIYSTLQQIATAKDQKRLAEDYAETLDNIVANTQRAAGADQDLVDRLVDLKKQLREVQAAEERRKEQEREAEKAAAEAETARKHAFEAESKIIKARYTEIHRDFNKQYEEEKQLADFVIESRGRVAATTMTGRQRDLMELSIWYQKQIQTFSEEFQGEERFAQAREQLQIEFDEKRRAIEGKYATDEAALLRRRIALHANTAGLLYGFINQTLDDAQRSMSDLFFDAMSGKFHDLDDVVKQFFSSFKRHIADFLADKAMKKLEEFLLNLVLTHFGGGSVTAGATFGTNAVPEFTPGMVGFQGGGIAATGFSNAPPIITAPTMLQAGEGSRPEAVVPMQNGQIPVALIEDNNERPFMIQQGIRVVLEPALLAAMKTSPDETVIHLANDYARGGITYNMINGRGRR